MSCRAVAGAAGWLGMVERGKELLITPLSKIGGGLDEYFCLANYCRSIKRFEGVFFGRRRVVGR